MPNIKHGASGLKLYRVYYAMRNRCYNPKSDMYASYGGRGISIGDEWRGDLGAFVTWALANGYKDGLSIDRIDNDGNYEPSNCRWVDMKTQARNKQYNRYLTFNGETKCMAEWGEITGIPPQNIAVRIDRCGMTVEQALTVQPIPRKMRFKFDGEIFRAKDLAKKLGVSPSHIYRRFEKIGAIPC
jgi:hypothetical protein